jgi:hypothetical protein
MAHLDDELIKASLTAAVTSSLAEMGAGSRGRRLHPRGTSHCAPTHPWQARPSSSSLWVSVDRPRPAIRDLEVTQGD